MSDLAGNPYASIVELSKAYRNKSVSPSEVTKAQLARIDVLDTKLGSYQTIYSDEALAAAKVADKAFTDDAHLGPFHGCLLYTSPSPRDNRVSRMPSSA